MPAELRDGSPQFPSSLAAVPLTELRAGDSGALHTCDLLDGDRQLLSALGLADRAKFRLCKAGSPWIVQVRGTRIGIAEAVARKIKVLPHSSR
jgi:Fe2+ transport system protein FeoA